MARFVCPVLLLAGFGAPLAPLASASAASASTQIQVKVCPPATMLTVTKPAYLSSTHANVIAISGMTNPGLIVTITNNDNHAYSSIVASSNGRFANNIPLKPGFNTLDVTAKNACGQSQTASRIAYRLPARSFWHSFSWILSIVEFIIILVLLALLLLCKRKRKKEMARGKRKNKR